MASRGLHVIRFFPGTRLLLWHGADFVLTSFMLLARDHGGNGSRLTLTDNTWTFRQRNPESRQYLAEVIVPVILNQANTSGARLLAVLQNPIII